jgi:hypothetical protein
MAKTAISSRRAPRAIGKNNVHAIYGIMQGMITSAKNMFFTN